MKQKLTLILLFSLLMPLSACKSPEQVAYKTLASVATTVDAAMATYHDAYVQGSITTENDLEVKKAYQTYQQSMYTAIKLARMDYSALAPQEVLDNAERVVNLIIKLI